MAKKQLLFSALLIIVLNTAACSKKAIPDNANSGFKATASNTITSSSVESKKKKIELVANYTKATIIKAPFAKAAVKFENNNLAWYQEVTDKKWSLINAKGEIKQQSISEDWDDHSGSNDTDFSVWYEQNELHGLIDSEGNLIQEPFARNTVKLNNDLPSIVPVPKDKKDAYSDRHLEMITDSGRTITSLADKSLVSPFTSSGFAWCKLEDKGWNEEDSGIMDDTGAVVKQPFVHLSRSYFENDDEDIAEFKTHGDVFVFDNPKTKKYGIVNIATATIIKEPFAEELTDFNEFGVAWFSEYNAVYGLISGTGEILQPPMVTEYKDFNQLGITWFKNGSSKDKWGLISAKGQVISEPFAYEVEDFTDYGYATFKNQSGLLGVVNSEGKVVKDAFAQKIEIISEKNFVADDVLYDSNGQQINIMATHFKPTDDQSLVWFEQNSLWGLMKSTGEILATPFIQGFASLTNEEYSERSVTSNFVTLKTAIYKDGNGCGIVSAKGEIITKNNYDGIIFSEFGIYWFYDEGSGLYGILNNLGEIIKEPFVQKYTIFNANGIAWYYKDGIWGIVGVE